MLWSRQDLDFYQPQSIADRLGEVSFDVLINAAGMTSPDLCETEPENARLANVTAPQVIAEYCQARRARMIHFSTDYVFRGEPLEIWREEDAAEPINVYGRTKRVGELAVLKASPDALVARVSWLFGPDKPSHPDNVIQRALQTDELTAVEDKMSVPTSNIDICGWIERIVCDHPETQGMLHLCNAGVASWHSWAEAALEIAVRIGLPVKTTRVKPVKLESLTQFKAQRPMLTRMSNAKLQNLLGIEIRNWRDALEDYLVEKYQDR